jgi:hypothetical protein
MGFRFFGEGMAKRKRRDAVVEHGRLLNNAHRFCLSERSDKLILPRQVFLCESAMNHQEMRKQTSALLKILELGQEDIRQGRYTSAEEVFAELDAMDKAELTSSRDQ